MKTKQGMPVLKLKKFGEKGEFEGYASVFGNRDSYGDVVVSGAFKDSLAEHAKNDTMPKLFWQHDSWKPIGSWLEMEEDDTGLKVKGRLNMDVQQGREAYALLEAGDIDGLSIGYRVRESEDDEVQGVTLLKELDLVEVSVVSLGANEQALVSSFKSIRAEGLPSLPEFEAFLRDAGFSKKEATAIAGHGLAQLLRSDSGEVEVVEGDEFMAELWAAMRDAPIIDETGEPD
ncbi:HK97 family phage prohead protease [Qipengyuania huizhouensis]|uniref:HK97 family phage prohead protease n=1 Tax=Qipengyuania huizhouensis TaxID=2867245 RepID=UPI001C87F261|nr:HK97 family phage prohead protease [Qipengyuania huizhouensis]MBX7459547.1 HK97 family phage prohead protease [Qipengyuania huizhouensis]